MHPEVEKCKYTFIQDVPFWPQVEFTRRRQDLAEEETKLENGLESWSA